MSSIRLLLADDHALFRQSLRAVLTDEPDFEIVGEASTAPDVLPQVAALKPDLLLLDVSLGDRDGLRVAADVRAAHPDLRILMLSMHNQPHLADQAMALGADGYALKEDTLDDLVYAIRSVLRGGHYISPTLLRAQATAGLTPKPPRLRGESQRQELTGRQREILLLVAAGKTNRDIAAELGLSRKTVENHRANIARQYGLTRAVDYVRYAIRRGWMEA